MRKRISPVWRVPRSSPGGNRRGTQQHAVAQMVATYSPVDAAAKVQNDPRFRTINVAPGISFKRRRIPAHRPTNVPQAWHRPQDVPGLSRVKSAMRKRISPVWRVPRSSPDHVNQIFLGNDKTIMVLFDDLQATLCPGGNRRGIQQHAVAGQMVATYSPAQLMQLRKSKMIRVFDHHQRGSGNIDADFHDSGRHQQLNFSGTT